jgi:hypothetical protein
MAKSKRKVAVQQSDVAATDVWLALSVAFERVAVKEGGSKIADPLLREKIESCAMGTRARHVLRDGRRGAANESLSATDWYAANVDWAASYFLRLPTSRAVESGAGGGAFVVHHFSDTDAAAPFLLPTSSSFESFGRVEAHGIEVHLGDFVREFPGADATPSLPAAAAAEAAPEERASKRGGKARFDWHLIFAEFIRRFDEKGPPENNEKEADRLFRFCLDTFKQDGKVPTAATLRVKIGVWLKHVRREPK